MKWLPVLNQKLSIGWSNEYGLTAPRAPRFQDEWTSLTSKMTLLSRLHELFSESYFAGHHSAHPTFCFRVQEKNGLLCSNNVCES